MNEMGEKESSNAEILLAVKMSWRRKQNLKITSKNEKSNFSHDRLWHFSKKFPLNFPPHFFLFSIFHLLVTHIRDWSFNGEKKKSHWGRSVASSYRRSWLLNFKFSLSFSESSRKALSMSLRRISILNYGEICDLNMLIWSEEVRSVWHWLVSEATSLNIKRIERALLNLIQNTRQR